MALHLHLPQRDLIPQREANLPYPVHHQGVLVTVIASPVVKRIGKWSLPCKSPSTFQLKSTKALGLETDISVHEKELV